MFYEGLQKKGEEADRVFERVLDKLKNKPQIFVFTSFCVFFSTLASSPSSSSSSTLTYSVFPIFFFATQQMFHPETIFKFAKLLTSRVTGRDSSARKLSQKCFELVLEMRPGYVNAEIALAKLMYNAGTLSLSKVEEKLNEVCSIFFFLFLLLLLLSVFSLHVMNAVLFFFL